MSNTYKHKGAGKYKNTDIHISRIHKSTTLMWDRHNSDFGEDKERQLDIKEKIAEKEMKEEVRTVETSENIDFRTNNGKIVMEKYKTIKEASAEINPCSIEQQVKEQTNFFKREVLKLERYDRYDDMGNTSEEKIYILVEDVLNLFSAKK
jgi:hypothetical protein